MLRPIANHDACSAAWAVIARRETSALGVLILEPMNSIPVPQCEIILFVDAQYRQDTIKISRRSDDVVERGPLRITKPAVSNANAILEALRTRSPAGAI